MKESKNIDRLFQEKFKDFEAHPSDRVWENIAFAKAKKKDRKVVPLWLRLGGVAAALAILFSIGSVFWNTPYTDTQLVETDAAVQTEGTDSESTLVDNNTKELPETINQQVSPPVVQNTTGNNTTSATNNQVPKKEEANKQTGSNSSFTKEYTAIAQQTASAKQTVQKDQDNLQTPRVTVSKGIADSEKSVATAISKDIQNVSEENDRPTIVDPSLTDLNEALNKKQEAVAQQNSDPAKTDEKMSLVKVAEALKNAEEAVADIDAPSNRDKWNVGAVAAPVYYGDFGGSGIDPQFKDNPKSGDVNLSYGVQVSYAVSDKFKVRTGVSNVDLSYGTNDISFSPDIAASRLAGVAYNSNGKFLSVTDRIGPQDVAQSDFQGGGSNISNGSLNQRVGYIEVPFEAVYILSDKRLGVEVIGGVSTLFVNDNEIAIESGGLRTPIGKSNSLNNVSFTTNVGIGLNYKVTESVHINMEPTLKYQLNAFDTSVGDFKPYYVGLYTGVSYRF